MKAQVADLDQDELTDARLDLRPQMENEGRERVHRAEGGRKINFWKFQGSISETDKLLGEDGMAERDEERKRLRRMEERQGTKRKTRAYQQER